MKEPFLITHIIGGTTSLLLGLLAFTVKKGSKLHIGAGKIFTWMMWITILSALILSYISQNIFLAGIGLFSTYQLLTGTYYLSISRKEKNRFNTILLAFGIISGVFLCITGIMSNDSQTRILAVVFGMALMVLSISDLLYLMNQQFTPKSHLPIALHGGRMGGAFLATLTAFLVVNADNWDLIIQFPWMLIVIWIAPGVIGGFFLSQTIRNYYSHNLAAHDRKN